MAYQPQTAVDNTQHLGTVTGKPIRQYVFDIDASADPRVLEDADEIIIKLNGRTLRRMTRSQAERMGLIADR